MRRRGRHRQQLRERAAAIPEAQPSTQDTVLQLALQARIAKATTELPEPLREAVILRFHDGLAYADIAREQGVSIDNARQRVKRSLDRVRAQLARDQAPTGAMRSPQRRCCDRSNPCWRARTSRPLRWCGS